MNEQEFCSSIFEVADLHVETLDASDYAAFLQDLLGRVGDGQGGVALVAAADLAAERAAREVAAQALQSQVRRRTAAGSDGKCRRGRKRGKGAQRGKVAGSGGRAAAEAGAAGQLDAALCGNGSPSSVNGGGEEEVWGRHSFGNPSWAMAGGKSAEIQRAWQAHRDLHGPGRPRADCVGCMGLGQECIECWEEERTQRVARSVVACTREPPRHRETPPLWVRRRAAKIPSVLPPRKQDDGYPKPQFLDPRGMCNSVSLARGGTQYCAPFSPLTPPLPLSPHSRSGGGLPMVAAGGMAPSPARTTLSAPTSPYALPSSVPSRLTRSPSTCKAGDKHECMTQAVTSCLLRPSRSLPPRGLSNSHGAAQSIDPFRRMLRWALHLISLCLCTPLWPRTRTPPRPRTLWAVSAHRGHRPMNNVDLMAALIHPHPPRSSPAYWYSSSQSLSAFVDGHGRLRRRDGVLSQGGGLLTGLKDGLTDNSHLAASGSLRRLGSLPSAAEPPRSAPSAATRGLSSGSVWDTAIGSGFGATRGSSSYGRSDLGASRSSWGSGWNSGSGGDRGSCSLGSASDATRLRGSSISSGVGKLGGRLGTAGSSCKIASRM